MHEALFKLAALPAYAAGRDSAVNNKVQCYRKDDRAMRPIAYNFYYGCSENF